MITYLLKASLILVVLTFFYNWTVKRETFYATNRMLLWINMLAVVLLPVVSLPDFAFSVVQNELAATLKPLPQTITNAGFVPSVNYRQNLHNELTLWNYISFVYWIGVIILTIKLIGQLTKLLKFIIKSKSENTIEGFKIVQNELVTSPFSFFKWIVLNRHLYDSIELEHILTHESIHARQWHSIDVLVAEILKIVLWFNPVAWWNQRLVQENLEYLVDDTVLNAGFDKKAYQFSLLKTVLASDKQILTNYFNSSLLKNRIKMMNRSQSSILTISKYLFCVFALWVSAAFAKPYQQKMVDKIVKKAPVLKALLEPRLNEITIPAIEVKAILPEINSVKIDTTKFPKIIPSSTKYVVFQDNVLYWVITPKTTFDDLTAIRTEMKKYDYDFRIVELKMDVLNHYIERIEITTQKQNGGSAHTQYGDMKGLPIKSNGGFVDKRGARSIGLISDINHPLKDLAISDENIAENEFKEREELYKQIALEKQISKFGGSGSTFTNDYFKKIYTKNLNELKTIAPKAEGFIAIGTNYKNALFFVNSEPSSLETVEEISAKSIQNAILYDAYTDEKHTTIQNYVLINLIK